MFNKFIDDKYYVLIATQLQEQNILIDKINNLECENKLLNAQLLNEKHINQILINSKIKKHYKQHRL